MGREQGWGRALGDLWGRGGLAVKALLVLWGLVESGEIAFGALGREELWGREVSVQRAALALAQVTAEVGRRGWRPPAPAGPGAGCPGPRPGGFWSSPSRATPQPLGAAHPHSDVCDAERGSAVPCVMAFNVSCCRVQGGRRERQHVRQSHLCSLLPAAARAPLAHPLLGVCPASKWPRCTWRGAGGGTVGREGGRRQRVRPDVPLPLPGRSPTC